MDSKRTYQAILFRQRPQGPLQVAFVAPSTEVDAWARVPKKKTGNIRNFQRAQIARHIQEVERFFGEPSNASPTAVVVGFDPIRATGRVVAAIGAKVVQPADVAPGSPQLGTLEVSWPVEADPKSAAEYTSAILSHKDQLREFVYAELTDITGLPPTELDDVAALVVDAVKRGLQLEPAEGDVPDLPEEEITENEDAEDEVSAAAEFEIPSELREKLPGLSPSEHQVVAGRLYFLAQIDPEVLAGRGTDYLKSLHAEVRDELKPGILIDGQHRIMGTKKLGKVPFLVTALPDAAWPELAFQFIVTNRTARRVPESLLISIVGNSLSKQQRSSIEERLRQAGIRVGLIEAVMRVHEDEVSPFYNMLAFGIANEPGFLDAAAMRGKVIQPWYERVAPILGLFNHLSQGKTKQERTDDWKAEELWFEMFVAFWDAVKQRYEGSAVFSSELTDKSKKTPASKLMTATVLKIFQETVLRHLHKFLENKATTEGVPIAESLPDEKRFRELVGNTLKRLTPDFFTEWALTGFDGSKGARDDLADAIRKVISSERTIAQLKNENHRLFKGEN